VTNADLEDHRVLINAGAQMDVQLMLLIQQPLTLSVGYANAFERNRPTSDELMVSLKILE
jgi:hypothetical protein